MVSGEGLGEVLSVVAVADSSTVRVFVVCVVAGEGVGEVLAIDEVADSRIVRAFVVWVV